MTVAVPVYNVKKYLNRCVDSIIPQLTSEMELLLVDDGSTDGSGEICDQYMKQYPSRVRVIHQDNHGLAYVRNVCIKESYGEYISFIDSDDYITKGAYSHFFELLEKTKADVLCFGHYDVYGENDTYGFDYVDPAHEKIKYYTPEEAIDLELISPDIDVITCNKIIRRTLYEGIEYPVGRLYEDMFTTYKFLAKAGCIVSTNLRYYVYCHREGSIGQQKFNPRAYDLERAVRETYKFGIRFCKRPKNLVCGYIYWRTVVNNMMVKSCYEDKKFTKKTQRIIRKHWKAIYNNQILNRTRKVELWLLAHCFPLYKVVYRIYIKRNR